MTEISSGALLPAQPAMVAGASDKTARLRKDVRKTMAEAVADLLRAEIDDGLLKPGARLLQNEVASRLGVSTTPVREAFVLLQSDGLVNIDRHRGVVVFEPTPGDLRELYEVRIALEGLALARSVPYLTPAILDQAGEMLEKLNATARSPHGHDEWRAIERDFHMLFYRCGSSDRLLSLIDAMRAAVRPFSSVFERDMVEAEVEHESLLAACKSGDVGLARHVIERHIMIPAEAAIARLERLRASQDALPQVSSSLPQPIQ